MHITIRYDVDYSHAFYVQVAYRLPSLPLVKPCARFEGGGLTDRACLRRSNNQKATVGVRYELTVSLPQSGVRPAAQGRKAYLNGVFVQTAFALEDYHDFVTHPGDRALAILSAGAADAQTPGRATRYRHASVDAGDRASFTELRQVLMGDRRCGRRICLSCCWSRADFPRAKRSSRHHLPDAEAQFKQADRCVPGGHGVSIRCSTRTS